MSCSNGCQATRQATSTVSLPALAVIAQHSINLHWESQHAVKQHRWHGIQPGAQQHVLLQRSAAEIFHVGESFCVCSALQGRRSAASDSSDDESSSSSASSSEDESSSSSSLDFGDSAGKSMEKPSALALKAAQVLAGNDKDQKAQIAGQVSELGFAVHLVGEGGAGYEWPGTDRFSAVVYSVAPPPMR